MRKGFYRSLAILFSIWMAVNSLTACGRREAAEEELPPTFQEAALDPVTLTFYFFGTPSIHEKNQMDEVLAEISEVSRLNIQLDFRFLPINQYIQTIRTLGSSDQSLDGFYCLDPSPLAFDFVQMAQEGIIAELTSLLPIYAPYLLQQYTEDDLASVTLDGRIYAVPSLYPLAYGTYAVVREDFMEKYHIPDIRSFEAYEAYLRIIRDNESLIPGKIAGYVIEQFIGTSGYCVLDPFLALLYDWEDPEMRIVPLELSRGFTDMVHWIVRWNQEGYLHQLASPTAEIWQESRRRILSGEISSFLITPEFSPGQTAESIVYELNSALTLEDPQAYVQAYRLYPDRMVQRVRGPMGLGFTGSALAFNATSPNIVRGLLFLEWVHSRQEHYDLLMYGIEGQHYQLDNGQIALLPREGAGSRITPYMNWSGRWAFENLEYARLPQGYPSAFREARQEYVRTHTRYAPHEGFHMDVAAIQSFYERRLMFLANNLYFPLLSGRFTAADIDELLDNYESLGFHEMTLRIQQQLDGWRRSSN